MGVSYRGLLAGDSQFTASIQLITYLDFVARLPKYLCAVA